MTDFKIFTNFVLSCCYICPGSDKLEPGKLELEVLNLMRSLASQSCSCWFMAGGHQEPIFVKGLKMKSRCLGYMSEMSRKEAVLQVTQTEESLRAN